MFISQEGSHHIQCVFVYQNTLSLQITQISHQIPTIACKGASNLPSFSHSVVKIGFASKLININTKSNERISDIKKAYYCLIRYICFKTVK